MTQRDKWAKRPSVLRYRRFKDQVRLRRVQLPQPCRVIFYLKMPRGWSATRKFMADGEPHTARPDLDNLLKALADACCVEDSHLWSIHAEKRWTLGAARIEVLPCQPVEHLANLTTQPPRRTIRG